MQIDPTQDLSAHSAQSARTVSDVALAYFTNARCLHDAATDLRKAGFSTNEINTTDPIPSFPPHPKSSKLQHLRSEAADPDLHSRLWEFKHSFMHDMHRRGEQQLSNENPTSPGTAPPCIHINLHDTLAAMGVAEDTIWLLEHEIEADRIFMLVDARDRVDEANRIMETDCGQVRTEYLKGRSATHKSPYSEYGETFRA